MLARYPIPDQLAGAEVGELEELIRSTGFYKNKAKKLLGMASAVVDRFDGELPTARWRTG